MTAADFIFCALIAAAAGVLLGYSIGFQKGKALGWQEHHFEDIEKDKARRDRLGRFKSSSTQ